jgi:hypothetical protein
MKLANANKLVQSQESKFETRTDFIVNGWDKQFILCEVAKACDETNVLKMVITPNGIEKTSLLLENGHPVIAKEDDQ